MEKISVIVPIYKVEAYIDRCIESIINQTYHNLEIILVDDGSPDQCPEICDEWAKKDKRIRVIHKKNGGLSDARNVGLAAAKGDYISFVDSDDWIEPDFISVLYTELINANADISACGVDYVSESGEVLRKRKCDCLCLDKIEALRRLVKEDGVYQTVWNKLYRRETIGSILFEVGRCNEDDFWTYQIFDRAKKIVITNQTLYHYFQRDGSIMGAGFSVKRLDGLVARVQRMEYLQKYEELARFTREQLYGDCLYMFQSAVRCLSVEERKVITDYIMKLVVVLPNPLKCKSISYKYRCWFLLFTRFPYMTSNIRNRLKIGL